MTNFPCFVTRDLNAHLAREERYDALYEAALATLELEFLAAIGKPETLISTPGWTRQPRSSLIECFAEDICPVGEGGKLIAKMIEALRETPKGLAVLAQMAREHAERHAEAEASDE